MIIDWGDNPNTLLKNEVPPKSIFNVNPIKALQVQKIVENKFSMFIWINHNRISVPVNVCTPGCADCNPTHAISAGALTTDKLLNNGIKNKSNKSNPQNNKKFPFFITN